MSFKSRVSFNAIKYFLSSWLLTSTGLKKCVYTNDFFWFRFKDHYTYKITSNNLIFFSKLREMSINPTIEPGPCKMSCIRINSFLKILFQIWGNTCPCGLFGRNKFNFDGQPQNSFSSFAWPPSSSEQRKTFTGTQWPLLLLFVQKC